MTSKLPTRNKLIRAAITQFQIRGFYGCSTQDILDFSKVPRGSLYHHFPGGKTDLAIACVQTITEDVIERVRELRLKGNSSRQVMEKLAAGIAHWLEEKDWKEGSLIPALTHEFAGKDAKMHEVLQQSYLAILAEFTQMVEVEGYGLDEARVIAMRFLAQLDGGVNLSRALKSQSPLVEYIDWNALTASPSGKR